MDYGYIIEKAYEIKNKYTYCNTKALCREMGIILNPANMGKDINSGKGFCFRANGLFVITFNADLTKELQNAIIYHELGHIVLHYDGDNFCFNDYSMFDESRKKEIEANLFAAELMMTDEDVLDALNDDGSFYTAAAKLYVPFEFIDYKFRLMNYKGYKIAPPMLARADFLKDLKMVCNDE